MVNLGGNVDPVRGPFHWKLRDEPQKSPTPVKSGHDWGPRVFLVQIDADGNEYDFAEISALADPADVRKVLKVLNKARIT